MEVTDLIYDFSALFRGELKNFAKTDGSLRYENEQLWLKGSVDAASFSPDIVGGKVDYEGTAQVKTEMIELRFDISVELTVVCSRCSIETPKSDKFSATFFLTNSEPTAQSIHSSDDQSSFDTDVIYIEDGILDIDELVQQTTILSFPMRFLCKKNCKGLCPKCGTDLNKNSCDCPTFEPDPRLAKLKDYLTKFENHTNEEVE